MADQSATLSTTTSPNTTSSTPIIPPEPTCALNNRSGSDPFHIGNTYGGIPTSLIVNGIVWLLLLLAFILIRKSAFKLLTRQGLPIMLANTEQNMGRLVQIFFTDTGPPPSTRGEEGGEGGRSRSPSVTPSRLARRHSAAFLMEQETFGAWLKAALTMGEEQLLRLAGPDAVQYLRFQKYLILLMSITTLFCICLILPLNFQGSMQGTDVLLFSHTTLANLDPDSSLLYVHIGVAFLLFPITIFIMRRFSEGLKFRDDSLIISHTLQVEGIPHHLCQEDRLRRHFQEAYPDHPAIVKELRVAYDVSHLTSLTQQLEDADLAREHAERHLESGAEPLTMYPVCMARFCPCFCSCCSTKVDVADYYRDKVEELEEEVSRARAMSLDSPLGMAFLTVNTLNQSKKVYEDHRRGAFWCPPSPPLSSLSPSLRPERWRVTFAPPPKDIYWENLNDQRRWLVFRKVVANTCLLLVALFLTTPEYIVAQLETILPLIFGEDAWKLSSLVTSFLPQLMIWSFTALLPVLVAYSDRWLGHWYRSEENHSIMIKSFWYLWVIVVIFPTFGFTTAMAVIENLFSPTGGGEDRDLGGDHGGAVFRWDCIFLPDSGAFFVNYVITAAFIGSGLELLRVPELLWYGVQVFLSRTKAEHEAIHRAVATEFRFGEQYARMLLILSMVVMYSISCPLITPFGLVYFLLKHLVDKHNLAFVYDRSKINKNVHRSAINFVMFSVALLQVFMVIFSFIRSLNHDNINVLTARTKISLLLFVLTLMVFAAQTWSDLCKRLSPIKYEDVLYSEDGGEEEQGPYTPPVLEGGLGPGLEGRESRSPSPPAAYGTFQPASPATTTSSTSTPLLHPSSPTPPLHPTTSSTSLHAED